MDELYKVWIITNSGICIKLRKNLAEFLRVAVVTSEIVCGSICTIADSKYVYQDTIRRRYIVKRGRITAFAIIPLMVSESDVDVFLELRIDIKEFSRQFWMHSDQGELAVGKFAEIIGHDYQDSCRAPVFPKRRRQGHVGHGTSQRCRDRHRRYARHWP